MFQVNRLRERAYILLHTYPTRVMGFGVKVFFLLNKENHLETISVSSHQTQHTYTNTLPVFNVSQNIRRP